MITVERWAETRQLYHVAGLSQRAIARRLGVPRKTVWRAIHSQEVPKYGRPLRPSLFDAYKPLIESLLREEPKLSARPHQGAP